MEAHNQAKSGPRTSGEQAQNPTKPTQIYATSPWAKYMRSQEVAQQNYTQGGPPRVWVHPWWPASSPTLPGRFILPLQG